jgi:molecular chaperone DnaJ
MSQKRCYYEVLGCSRTAAPEDLRRAYKQLALKHHPDRNGGDAKAEAAFKEVNEAYQVLADEQKRQIYDRFGHAGLEGGGGFVGGMGDVFAHMQDLFSEMFSGGGGFGGRPRRGGDVRIQQRLTFKQAAFGCKNEVVVHAPARCEDCSGSGAMPGTKPETCAQCRGSGQVSNARGFVMFTTTCGRCRGQGVVIKSPCKTCGGAGAVERPRKVMVTFPAGIDAGQRLRVPGQGMPGPNGTPPGDLYVDVDIEEDPRFERDGVDVVTKVNVSFAEAALGAQIKVPSIRAAAPGAADGEAAHTLTVPGGTQPGSVFTLKGEGIPRLDGRGRGSLVVVVQVDVPGALSDRARTLLGELDAELRACSAGEVSTEGRRRVAGK